MSLAYLGSAWMVGIFLGSLVSWPAQILVVAAFPLLLLAFVLRRLRPSFVQIALCLALACLGAARMAVDRPAIGAGTIAQYNDKDPIQFRGTVDAYPDARGTYTNLKVRATQIHVAGGWRAAEGHVLVRTAPFPSFSYGDQVEIRGKPETPPVFPDFSYKDYLARKGIYSLVRYARVDKLGSGGGQPVYAFLYGIRSRGKQVIARILPEPQSALLVGILLGLEAGIPRALMDDFSATGTTHIIVISGFNITIIAGLLLALSKRVVGSKRAAYLTTAGIVGYTILVGADPAVVRAAIMGIVYVWGLQLGRQSEALTSLIFSAVVMTLLNPWTLWDLGFQLSFLATLSLIHFTPVLQRRFEALLERIWPGRVPSQVMALLNDALIVTLAAQIMTTPLIVSVFGRLSLVSLLTNFLILPIQPAVMLSGGAATIAGLVALPLGRLLAWFPWITLTYTIRVVEWTARFPHASLEVGRFPRAWLLPYYGLLLAGPWVWRQRGKRLAAYGAAFGRRLRPVWYSNATLAVLGIGALISWSAALSTPDGRLHLHILDVGEGNAVLIVTPGGSQVLVDGGPDPTRLLPGLGRAMPFWDHRVEWVVVTRLASSHLTGLLPVLERYEIGGILSPPGRGQGSAYQAWKTQIAQKHIPQTKGRDGQQLTLGQGAVLEVLHPPKGSDDSSLLLRLQWKRNCFLLAQGLGEKEEAAVVQRYRDLHCAVLIAGRNGSKHATTTPFLNSVRPALVVIPVGAKNRFGHPAPEMLDRVTRAGARILRTDQQGDIEITVDGQQYWLRTGR
ncbi:MAG: DUF4131 domain-containing protein [Chloroflexi bacterium]|nr:DUF4131 domain-containing protein [Chloroflexota bacterium]